MNWLLDSEGRNQGRVNPGVLVLIAVGALLFLGFGMRGCWVSLTGMPDRDLLGVGLFPWSRTPYGWLGLSGLIQVGLAIWVGFDAHRRGLNGLLWGLLVLFTFVVGLIVYLIVGPSMASRGGLFESAAPGSPKGASPGWPPGVGVRGDTGRADTPRSDSPRADSPRSDSPQAETPRADAPRSDSPRSDSPRTDLPQADEPAADAVGPDLASAGVAPADAGHRASVEAPSSDTLHCPACKDEVRPEFKVCPYCGAALCCRQCQSPVEAGWKVCPHCATPIESTE